MEEKLREYARLLVQVGLNPYPGQRMVISSPVECAAFARLCAREAYDAGCCEVVMNWTDDTMTRMKYLHAAEEVFGTVPLWRRHFFNDQALEGTAYLAISASDPENLKGVDPDRLLRLRRGNLHRLLAQAASARILRIGLPPQKQHGLIGFALLRQKPADLRSLSQTNRKHTTSVGIQRAGMPYFFHP